MSKNNFETDDSLILGVDNAITSMKSKLYDDITKKIPNNNDEDYLNTIEWTIQNSIANQTRIFKKTIKETMMVHFLNDILKERERELL